MTFSDFSSSIFFLESEVDLGSVQDVFLETHKAKVKVIGHTDARALATFNRQDILIMDIERNTLKTLHILSGLLKRPQRPRLLITTCEGQVFQRYDTFEGSFDHILFKPFTLTDLTSSLRALTAMSDANSIDVSPEHTH